MRAVLRHLIIVTAIALPTSASAQVEVAVAEQRIDVNGDGTLDVVRIENTASVSVSVTGNKKLDAWKPFTTATGKLVGGTLEVAVVKKRVLIAATAEFGSERRGEKRVAEAMALELKNGTLVELWRGAVGPVGRDREYSLHLDLVTSGLVRYQSRAGVSRCDNKTAYLFREGYDFKANKFRSVYNRHAITATAGTLTATRTAPAVAPDGSAVFRASGASHQRGASNAGELSPPREIDDSDASTAWIEGLGGDGRGEFITVTTNMPDRSVRALRIVPGDASSKAAFETANRLKKIGVLIGDDLAYWVEFPTDPSKDAGAFSDPYWVTLPTGAATTADCVTVVIADLYPGNAATRKRSGTTAIAELAVLADIDMDPDGADAALAAQVAAGGDAGRSASRLLAKRGTAAAEALVAQVQKSSLTAEQILHLRRALARVGHPLGVAQIVAGLAAADVSEGDRELFAGALASIGDEAVAPLAAIITDDSAAEGPRVAAADALGGIDTPAARAALVAAAGTGTRTLRRTISHHIGTHGGAPELVFTAIAAAEAAGDIGREADLWRAMRMWDSNAARAALVTPLIARLGTATDYELRYRLYQVAGSVEDAAGVIDALTASIATTDQSAHDVALRRVAADALATNPSAAARPLVLSLVADADPGVRARAAIALSERTDTDDDSDAALIARLETDTWPHVRRVAAAGLAQRCDRERAAATALYTAVGSDDDIDVRREAIVALVACRAEGVGQHLVDVASDSDMPVPLRQRAISLIGVLGDSALAPAALALLETYRSRAWSDEDAIRLAAAAASSVGKLGKRDGITKLVEIANDASFPELQAAAATALGETCPGKAKPVFDKLASSPERAVSLAAKAARNKCTKLWFPDD